MIEVKPIEGSSNIAAAGYSPDLETLRVEFQNGSQYDYHGVTPEVATAFFEAPSQGEYLNRIIKPAHPAAKVEKEKSDANSKR